MVENYKTFSYIKISLIDGSANQMSLLYLYIIFFYYPQENSFLYKGTVCR